MTMIYTVVFYSLIQIVVATNGGRILRGLLILFPSLFIVSYWAALFPNTILEPDDIERWCILMIDVYGVSLAIDWWFLRKRNPLQSRLCGYAALLSVVGPFLLT